MSLSVDAQTLVPSRFDVHVAELPLGGVPVVEPAVQFPLDPAYAGAWVVAGDVDGDGRCEIVSARNVDEHDVHYTCAVVVHRLDGSVLWRWGQPHAGRSRLHHDVACQIFDWDGDGCPEVVVADRDAVVVLDGATGAEKRRMPIPVGASDCLVFANLEGGPRATDLLVKDRYWNLWALDQDGRVRWQVAGPGGYRTAHQPYPLDIDGDGRDEIMAGFALLNPDGTVRWTLSPEAMPLGQGHLDCARPLEDDLVLTLCGDLRIARVGRDGQPRWSVGGYHFESIDVGRLYPGRDDRQIVVDIDHHPLGTSPVWVMDGDGGLLGQFTTTYGRHHLLVDWLGDGSESLVIGQERLLFDGDGRPRARFALPADPAQVAPDDGGHAQYLCAAGNLLGTGRADLLYHTNPGSMIWVFANTDGATNAASLGTGVNCTLY